MAAVTSAVQAREAEATAPACAFTFLCWLKGRRAETWAVAEVAESPRQPARLCYVGSVALGENWLIHVARWLLGWSFKGVVLFLATGSGENPCRDRHWLPRVAAH